MDKLNIDWKKRFKNLYIDVESTIKNIIRFDWTENSKKEKVEFNKRVDYIIGYIKNVNDVYNNMVDHFNNLEEEYKRAQRTALNKALGLERENESIQSKILSYQITLKELKDRIKKVKDIFSRSSIKFEWESLPENNKRVFKNEVASYNDEINAYRKSIRENIKNRDEARTKREFKNNKFNEYNSHCQKLQSKINALNAFKQQNEENSDGSWTSVQENKLSEFINRKNLLDTQIISLKADIESLNKYIKRCDEGIAHNKNNLKKIFFNVVKRSQEIIDNNLKNLKIFADSSNKEIDEKRTELKSQKNKIKEVALEKNIASSKMIRKLIENIYKNFREISTLASLENINNNKDYGKRIDKGFFVTLNTKKKFIDNLKKQIDAILNNMNKNILEIHSQQNKIKVLNKNTKESDTNIISDKIKESLPKIEKLREEIDKSVNEFITNYKNLKDISLIKPIMGSDGIINKVCEAVLPIDKIF